MALPAAIFSRFEGGLNTNDKATEIAPNEAQILKHLFVDALGRMVYAGGQHKVIPSQVDAVRGLTRYVGSELSRLMYVAGKTLKTFDEVNLIEGDLMSDIGSDVGNVEFTSLYDRVFFVDGKGAARVWYGTGDVVRAGIIAPATAPTGSAAGSGNLNSTGNDGYRWYVVFKNAQGIRSNPSPPSLAVPLTNEKASITNIPVSPDPQVTSREIYRNGGAGGAVPRFVGIVADNSTTTFTDNTSDDDLSLTQVETANDPAPDAASLLYAHVNRLFVSGVAAYPYRVWYSTYGQPEYFAESNVGEDADLVGGSFDVPPRDGNRVVGLASTGSVLVIGRERSIDILLGSSGTAFRVRQVAEIGVASHRSMVRCDNVVVFLGGDAMVYILEDAGPRPLGKKIERSLLSIDGYWLRFACAAYVGQRYILCVPRGPGLTPFVFAFDFRNLAWSDLSAPDMAATQMISDQATTVRGELLMATDTSYLTPEGDNYTGIVSALTLTDPTPAAIAWKSPAVDMGDPLRLKRVKSIQVEGDLSPVEDGEPVMVTIETALPGGANGEEIISRSYRLKRNSGRLLATTTHADLVGRTVTVGIAGDITKGEIQRIEIEYAVMG